jgi:hypothetical protein
MFKAYPKNVATCCSQSRYSDEFLYFVSIYLYFSLFPLRLKLGIIEKSNSGTLTNSDTLFA